MEKYLISFILWLLPLSGFCNAGGLHFPGNECRFADRSSYCVLKPEFVPGSVGRLELEFEYVPHNLRSPGYILFVKNAKGEQAFNLTYSHEGENGMLSFAQDGKRILAASSYPLDGFPHRLPVSITLDILADSVIVSIGETSVSADLGFDDPVLSPQIYFGMSGHILETASFSIGSLTLKLDDSTVCFPLDESDGTDVHSSDGRIMGEVSNPSWLINRSYYWTEIFSKTFQSPAGCVFADSRGEFMIYSGDSLTIFDPRLGDIDTTPFASIDKEWYNRLGMGFYNSLTNSIIAYELNYDRTFVGDVDIDRMRCDVKDKGSVNLQMHHHCAEYLPAQDKLILFGGYGNRRYYNDFVEYDLGTCRWDTAHFSGDVIPPRFFASMCVTPDGRGLYLYGGKGNALGKQDVGVEYYYDLYHIDLDSGLVKKLWDHPSPACNRVPTRRMIPDSDGQSLYVMAYPEFHPHSGLQLYRVSVADGKCEELGDTIPIVSEEIATNAALYFNPDTEKFYCVVQEFKVVPEPEEARENTVRIYSLDAPPVSLAAVRRYEHSSSGSSASHWWWLLLLFPAGIGGGWMYLRSKSRNTPLPQANILDSRNTDKGDSMDIGVQPNDAPQTEDASGTVEEECVDLIASPHRNALYLFGLFTAFDRNGRDVAYMFTPKNRQLFIYLLINSIGKEGVLSSDLNTLFWPDKPEENIKNLKNVTINKLRKVLQEFEGIELVHSKGYFKVEISDGFYCDYAILSQITDDFRSPGETEGMDAAEMLAIIERGKFLQGMEQPMFDYSRQKVENYEVSVLTAMVKRHFRSGDNSGTIAACNALAVIDPLSETAMEYAVKVNMRRKHEIKAAGIYNAFVKEYRRVMGEEYPRSFAQIAD